LVDDTNHLKPGIGDIPFVTAARLELDELLDQLIERIRGVQQTQGRLRGLLRANLAIAQGVDLEAVLRHIVSAAKDLVDAGYAALGVIQDGQLTRFLHEGMSPELVAQIGDLPQGKGLLGELVDNPRPVRVSEIAGHRSSIGFPAGHPPMHSFLGVPIRVRDRVFGNLYLADKQGAAEFTQDDEEVVLALAAAAGVAIQNATLFVETRRRRDWQAAMTAVTTGLLQGADRDQALASLVSQARAASEAEGAAFTAPSSDAAGLHVSLAVGLLKEWHGTNASVEGALVEEVLTAREPVLIPDASRDTRTRRTIERTPGVGALMVAPVVGDRGVHGVLTLARGWHADTFTTADLQMMTAFAAHAALVLDMSGLRDDADRLRALEDRERIAVDLQRIVIRNLFALGLSLQGLAGRTSRADLRDGITSQVDEVDRIIRAIREAVFTTENDAPRSDD
jgi:two-component system, NarL family, sensor histidine kinase DevS